MNDKDFRFVYVCTIVLDKIYIFADVSNIMRLKARSAVSSTMQKIDENV